METLITDSYFPVSGPLPPREYAAAPEGPEQDQLAALLALNILDSEAEPRFDELVRQAARLCDAPLACLSFIDDTRQWIKSSVGFRLAEIPRAVSICAHALTAGPFHQVHDINQQPLFRGNQLVSGRPAARSYAGHTIRSPEGVPVGVLSVLDIQPRLLAPAQKTALELLARQVELELELRRERSTRQAAEASAKAQQAFLANMSHEIRTPMNGILGLARLLKKSFLTTQQDEHLGIIVSTAENLLSVINDILDFTKIELGRIDLETLPFDVAATVRSTTRDLEFMAREKGLLLKIMVPDAPIPTVEGDPFRLRQVLVNLLTNALKFTDTGQVTVLVAVGELREQAVQVHFSVEDTGIGISPGQATEIFTAFGQASSSTARLYGGTGLGLSICKSLIELQGGTIWLESEPGNGSCFHFTLTYPLSAHAPARQETPRTYAPGLLHGLQILLVEDNPVNKLLANSLLQSWGVQVAIASDGQEALQLAGASPYDLILMDIQMPQLTGLQAIDYLRHTPGPNQHAAIIALTANAMRDEVEAYAHHGFTDHLLKPYHETDLYSTLVRHTGRADSQPVPEAAAPVPEAAAPAYNFSQLGKLAYDTEFIRKMQQLFVDMVPQQLQQLRQALERTDWPAASLITHGLKATYGSLQLEEALQCLAQLEKSMTPPADPTRFPSLLLHLASVTERMAAAFSRHLHG